MASGQCYRDLIVWQKAMDLAKRVYRFTQCFPRDEVYGMTSQVRRAAVSIPANIAEGQERHTGPEFRRFLGISRGSLAELETMLLLAKAFGYGDSEEAESLLESCGEVGRLLNGLRRSLASNQ